jgi:hypothetical protein
LACAGDVAQRSFTIGATAWIPLAFCTITANGNDSATIVCLGGWTITLRNGTRCTVYEAESAVHVLSCDDGTSVTIRDGKDGRDGTSCTIRDNGGGTKMISCDDGTSAVVRDGLDGKSCTVIDNSDGTKTIACDDGTSVVVGDGSPGADGLSSLVQTQPEEMGERCPLGGIAVRTGLDLNGSGVLEPGEVVQSSYICHGAPGGDGRTALVTTEPLVPGTLCPAGGFTILAGLDGNRDGELAEEEVTQSIQVCHGQAGADGAEGLTSLVDMRTEPTGERCAEGGFAIRSGLDANGNGALEDPEVVQTVYVCHGASGTSCTVADNGDGMKTISCADGTSVIVSDGEDGLNSLVRLDDEPAGLYCANGGVAIKTGLDTNRDGVLEDDEVTQTRYVCNGLNGYPNDYGEPNDSAGTATPLPPTPIVAVLREGESDWYYLDYVGGDGWVVEINWIDPATLQVELFDSAITLLLACSDYTLAPYSCPVGTGGAQVAGETSPLGLFAPSLGHGRYLVRVTGLMPPGGEDVAYTLTSIALP